MSEWTEERIKKAGALCASLCNEIASVDCTTCSGTGIMQAVVGWRENGPYEPEEITENVECAACEGAGKDPVSALTKECSSALRRITEQDQEIKRLQTETDRRGNLLEDVVNSLDLSSSAIAEHGSLGTEPAKLVALVLAEKDRVIRNLKHGIRPCGDAGGGG